MAWDVDSTHSQATFAVKHMMISTVKGQFDVLSGKVEIDEKHDGHLRSPDFFDAEKYPTISFKSHKVEPIGNNEYRVTGNLTMHGVTKEEIFHAEYAGQMKDLYGLQRAAFAVKGKVNRKDYGLNWNVGLEAGGVLVGDEVKVEIELAVGQKVAAPEAAAAQTA